MMSSQVYLQTNNVTIGYGKQPKAVEVLSGIDLQLEVGGMVALIGANGAGKSTLIRSLAGLQPVLAGDILLDNTNIKSLSPNETATRISVVLTDRAQIGYMTVGDLVALGRHPYTDWQGRLRETDRTATKNAMSYTGIEDLTHAPLYTLSDGQMQKAMIARALAQDTGLILLDEPLIHLDLPSKWEILTLLRRLAKDRGTAVVMATHELELSLQVADQLWLIDRDQQIICGAPEDLVLNGAIERVFNTDNYKFGEDLELTGTKDGFKDIELEGNGRILEWTAKALKRVGLNRVDHDAEIKVTCLSEDEANEWLLTRGNHIQSVNTIEELIRKIENILD